MFERSTLAIIFSSALVAGLCVSQSTNSFLPIWIVTKGLFIGDTMFHEVGHSLFAWLFGIPSVPSIMTLFGADKVGGLALMWDRSWIIQIISFCGLGYLCYRFWDGLSALFIVMAAFTLFVVIMAISGYHMVIINYMGHGSSILMGGFFLFRCWVNISARHTFERWLNGLFGFFLIFNNFAFGHKLAFDMFERYMYSKPINFIGHHDFVKIANQLSFAEIQGVAWFTMILAVFVTLLATFLAYLYSRDDESDYIDYN